MFKQEDVRNEYLFSDIDECGVSNGDCNQTCVNKPGTYECKCDKGFKLQDDNNTCLGMVCLFHGLWFMFSVFEKIIYV